MTLAHHAYLFIGERPAGIEQAEKIVAAHQPAHIDRRDRAIWDIEDSRRLDEQQGLKSWDGQPQFFIIVADSFTLPAQHAFLKVLEEPAAQAHFLIICHEEGNLLPTVRSRCEVHYLSPAPSAHLIWAENFIAARANERLLLVTKLLEQEIDRPRALKLAETLLLVYHQRFTITSTRELGAALEVINEARRYLADPSSSIKLIFEHLALVLL